MRLTRRSILRTGTLAAVSPLFGQAPWPATPARAQNSEPQWRHGLSLFGDLKYPPGFRHFDYVNPQAPKGGAVRLVALGTFDNFNQAIAGVRGLFAAAAGTICDTLMVSSLDEASAHYGLIAEAVSHPPNFASTSFRLRAAARHHDGKPITVEDVIYSFEAYKKYNPLIGAFYRDVVKVEQSGEREVTFTFDSPGNREMPVILGQLRVLPKHWWEGTRRVGQEARHRSNHARAAARQWRLPHQGVRPRPHGGLRAGEGLLGQGPEHQYRARQLRRDSLRVFSRPNGRTGSLQGRPCGLAHREQCQELGHGLRFSCGQARSGSSSRNSPSATGDHAGLRLQHAARQVQGCEGAARVQFRLRLRGDEQAVLLRSIQAGQQLLRGHRTGLFRAAAGGGAQNPGTAARQGAARGLHHTVCQSGRRHTRERARQFARGDAADAGGRLRGARSASKSTSAPARR